MKSILKTHATKDIPAQRGPDAAKQDRILPQGQRAEEMDLKDDEFPEEENVDPKHIETTSSYGLKRRTMPDIDARSKAESDDLDDAQAGDDEDSAVPITP